MNIKNKLHDIKKNKIYLITFIFVILVILILFGFIVYKIINKDKLISTYSTISKSPVTIIEKEMFFHELESFKKEIQQKYPHESTKIYKCNDSKEYYNYEDFEKNSSNPLKNPHTLIFINGGYSLSNKIKLPYFIFIPQINYSQLINNNKYYDIPLDDLKQYCLNNQKDIYIIKIKDLPPSNIEQNKDIQELKSNENEIKTYEIEKLDDIWGNSDFLTIKDTIAPYCLANLSDLYEYSEKLNAILYCGEDQANNISKDNENKMFIFVQINNEEKQNKKYKEDQNNNNINGIFGKKYKELSLEDILQTKNRKIIIFKIKYFDFMDEDHNPLTKSQIG